MAAATEPRRVAELAVEGKVTAERDVIVCELESLGLVWSAVASYSTPRVWVFREARCLYIDGMSSVGKPNEYGLVAVTGRTETGATAIWIQPAEQWSFILWTPEPDADFWQDSRND